MFFDYLKQLLAKYEQNLGPLYQPAFYLLGALIFLALLSAIIAAPILFLGSPLLAVVLQLFLLTIYFFLLRAVRYDVVDRFTFYLCFLVIVFSAATTIDADGQFRELLRNSSALEAIEFPHISIAIYGLLRGLGFFAWSIPLLLVYLTFAPDDGEIKSRSLLKYCLWSGFFLHAVAVTFILFTDGIYSNLTAPLSSAPEWLAASIAHYRALYAAFYLGCLITGFVALAVIPLFKNKTETSILITVAAASVMISLLFLMSQVYVDQLNARYPGARRGESIEVYIDPDSNRAIYTHPFLRRFGGELTQFESVFVCKTPDSGFFQYEAWHTDALRQQYAIERIRSERPELLFCVDG